MDRDKMILKILIVALITTLIALLCLSAILVKKNHVDIKQEQKIDINIGTGVPDVLPKINLNTATKEQLLTLEGVGEDKASEIIGYREENGNFKSIYELLDIIDENGRKTIGETTFNKIKNKVMVE